MQSGEEEEIEMEETWGSLVSLIRSKDGRLEEGNTIKMVKKEVTIGRCKGIVLQQNVFALGHKIKYSCDKFNCHALLVMPIPGK